MSRQITSVPQFPHLEIEGIISSNLVGLLWGQSKLVPVKCLEPHLILVIGTQYLPVVYHCPPCRPGGGEDSLSSQMPPGKLEGRPAAAWYGKQWTGNAIE